MSLRKISILLAIFSFSFFVIGTVKLIETYDFFREGLIEKKNFYHSVRAASINIMDDFRGERFMGLSPYSFRNIDHSLFHAEDRISDDEKDGIRAKLKKKLDNEGIRVFLGGYKVNRRSLGSSKMGKSLMVERKYFYGYEGAYHRKKKCQNRFHKEMDIFSSMEEAARNGYFPCKYCILEMGGK